MFYKRILFFLLAVTTLATFFGCSDDDTDTKPVELYFPPNNSSIWETVSPEDLKWNTSNLQSLYTFLDEKKTKAFIILQDGKIAVEWYSDDFSSTTNHTWNSAAKTLTAFTVGIAQQEGFLDLDDSSQLYLGENWSSMTDTQEKNVTVWHHLTMTTGLDYTVPDSSCTDPEDLLYKNEPGTFWYYHNAPYTLNHSIIAGATNKSFTAYFNETIRDRIGMQGSWIPVGCFHLYFSTARSMARFGLLNLNKGTWGDEVILSDENFFKDMTNTSQNMNKAYGYLWWLNGKESFRLPSSEELYTGNLIPNAPSDMYAGLGKDDQKLYVIPSKNMVIVRMGDNANDSVFGPSGFDYELWEMINSVLN